MWEAPGFLTWDPNTRTRSPGSPANFQSMVMDPLSTGNFPLHKAGILNLRTDGGNYQPPADPDLAKYSNMFNNDAMPVVSSPEKPPIARFLP